MAKFTNYLTEDVKTSKNINKMKSDIYNIINDFNKGDMTPRYTGYDNNIRDLKSLQLAVEVLLDDIKKRTKGK